MKKKLLIVFSVVAFFSILVILAGYPLNASALKKGWLKYGDGYYFGDALILDDTNYKNDTIYLDQKEQGVIVHQWHSFIEDRDEIIIKSIQTGKLGTYLLQ